MLNFNNFLSLSGQENPLKLVPSLPKALVFEQPNPRSSGPTSLYWRAPGPARGVG